MTFLGGCSIKGLAVLGLVLVCGIFLSGCQGIDLSKISDEDMARISKNAVICNSPYIRWSSDCCLDKNNNSICDSDEGANIPLVNETESEGEPSEETEPESEIGCGIFNESELSEIPDDIFYCPQNDGDLGDIQDSYMNDDGITVSNTLEIYCRNHVIRLCLPRQPCPWRKNINSNDNATCVGNYGCSLMFRNVTARGIDISHNVDTGYSRISEIYCYQNYSGYVTAWIPKNYEFYGDEKDVPGQDITIQRVVFSPMNEVKAGEYLHTTVKIKNTGKKYENVPGFLVSIPALDRVSVGTFCQDALEYGCAFMVNYSATSTAGYLRIPNCAEEGVYSVNIEVRYDSGHNSGHKVIAKERSIKIVAGDACKVT